MFFFPLAIAVSAQCECEKDFSKPKREASNHRRFVVVSSVEIFSLLRTRHSFQAFLSHASDAREFFFLSDFSEASRVS